ncbi:MAG TPA: hypothetical protein VNE63_24180 [Candidatus Acidoferrales bacterium]|nr:hypothetical protein [Candidatus Acidoferrales bacterium]
MSERYPAPRVESVLPYLASATRSVLLLAFSASLAFPLATSAQELSTLSTTWTVMIVLPARVVAGQPATLAVLGVDGRLASGVTVDLGADQHVTTDQTGRASFTVAPSARVLLARASGTSAAALVDPALAAQSQRAPSVAPVVSLREPFSICGTGLRGDADADRVRINGQPALAMAASPECLAVFPGPNSEIGAVQVSVETPGASWTASTTLVELDSEFPKPALLPNKKGQLTVRVRGSDQPLRIFVENQTPGILRFLRGDTQELLTSGGLQNLAAVEVQAIRSGDFSFDARLLPAPDADAARRYLEAAQSLAPENVQHEIGRLANQLSRHPSDFKNVRRELDQIRISTFAGDFRTLLDAALAAL